jgi:hypothetical protein
MSYEQTRVLESLAARASIQDLSIRQLRAFEEGDRRTWLGTFLVEGELELPSGERLAGHPALSAWFEGAEHDRWTVATDSVVEVDRVRAAQTSRILVASGSAVDVRDSLTFERGRWYFARRVVSKAGSVADGQARRDRGILD